MPTFRVVLEATNTTLTLHELYEYTRAMLQRLKEEMFCYVESLDSKYACPFNKIVMVKEIS